MSVTTAPEKSLQFHASEGISLPSNCYNKDVSYQLENTVLKVMML